MVSHVIKCMREAQGPLSRQLDQAFPSSCLIRPSSCLIRPIPCFKFPGVGVWATVKKNKRGEVKVSHLSPDGKFKSFCRT